MNRQNEAVPAEIERERNPPISRVRDGLRRLRVLLAGEKPLDEMSLEELENFLIEHANELDIIPVGRDERGIMKFHFKNNETQ